MTADPAVRPGLPDRRARILVVDDLPEKHLVYRSILEDPGYEMVSAHSGPEALKRLLEHEFALILLDINMPGMDGFETASLIRSRKRCAHVPILFVTAHADELHAIRGYEHGAVDYMLAPVDADVLRTKVGVFVELHRRANRLLAESESRVALAEDQRARLADVLEATTDWVLRFDESGAVHWANRAARTTLGLADNAVGTIADVHTPAGLQRLRDVALPAAQGTGSWSGENTMRAGDGRELPVSQVIVAHRSHGEVTSYSAIARDMSERVRIENELRRHRQELAHLVDERTAELRVSYDKLRQAEHMAAIGTLSAGISHDLSNLLLPVRMRIDAMNRRQLPPELLGDLTAIRKAAEYLQRLTNGLRMMTQNPDTVGRDEHFPVTTWWEDAEPLLKNAVPRGIVIRAQLPADLPDLRFGRAAFAQTMFNLVQNAGDALRQRGTGTVDIRAVALPATSQVQVVVQDDGPGMTEEVRRRCLEPFFSTKPRGLSTGLGLALVHGMVQQAGGSIEIQSEVGQGTKIVLTLAAWQQAPGQTQSASLAAVTVGDARLRAYLGALLRGLRFETREGPPEGGARLWVAAPDTAAAESLRTFLTGAEERVAVIVGGSSPVRDARVLAVADPKPAALREALQRAAAACRLEAPAIEAPR